MDEPTEMARGDQDVPLADISRRSRFSLIWVVPIAAALVGAWLAYQAVTRDGPMITIEFKTGSGLEAGKTKIKYRSVEVGTVQEVLLTDDLTRVLVKARISRRGSKYIREGTQFWVMRARIAGGEVQGLSTLLSGAYIGVAPSTSGKDAQYFVGLDKPPVLQIDEPGRTFNLRADRLGSINIGSPIFFKQIQVGRVLDYELSEDGEIRAKIFIRSPHDALVKRHSRFWNAGGLEAKLGADGIQISTESLVTILVGGIAFDTPRELTMAREAEEGWTFFLFDSYEDSRHVEYQVELHYVTFFKESVRGLKMGSDVEFHGFKVGEVVDVRFIFDMETSDFKAAALFKIQPERVLGEGNAIQGEDSLTKLLDAGLRTQLKTGNLITGSKVIGLDMYPDAKPVELGKWQDYDVIPSTPSGTQDIVNKLAQLADKLNEIPVEQIGQELEQTLAGLNAIVNSPDLKATVSGLGGTMRQLDREIAPSLKQFVEEAERTMAVYRAQMDADSVTSTELRRVLIELGDTVRSVRSIVDYLEQNPEALIRGRESK
jgi:paraquat-inducible protein B